MSCVVERTAGPSFQTVVIKRHFHCSEVPNRIATYRGGKLRLKDKPTFSCLRSRGSWTKERKKGRKKGRSCDQSSMNGLNFFIRLFLSVVSRYRDVYCSLSSISQLHSGLSLIKLRHLAEIGQILYIYIENGEPELISMLI